MLDPEDPDLQEALEVACMDALRGDPPGPLVASRLQRACADVLRRCGEPNARVDAVSDRRGTSVRILLPAPGDVVREVVLKLG